MVSDNEEPTKVQREIHQNSFKEKFIFKNSYFFRWMTDSQAPCGCLTICHPKKYEVEKMEYLAVGQMFGKAVSF